MNYQSCKIQFNFNGTDELLLSDYNENTIYSGIDFEGQNNSNIAFENCNFRSCRFNNLALENIKYSSCLFEKCEIILTNIKNSTLNDVKFLDCKIIGINFIECNDFGLSLDFEGSILDSVVIYEKSLKKTNIVKCKIKNSKYRLPEAQSFLGFLRIKIEY